MAKSGQQWLLLKLGTKKNIISSANRLIESNPIPDGHLLYTLNLHTIIVDQGISFDFLTDY